MNCTAVIYEGTVGAVTIPTIFHDELLSQIDVKPLNTVFLKIMNDLCANTPISI